MTIIYPMFLLVCLTCFVGMSLGIVRLKALKNKQIKLSYYKVFKGDVAPDIEIQFQRNFANLFEVPVLFYVVSIVSLVIKFENKAFLIMAWGFVLLRFLHSAIHLTYNNSRHRLITFAISSLLVIAMWVCLLMNLNKI